MEKTLELDFTNDEQSVLFFRRVKKDLGIPSTQKLVELVGKILGHVRAGLSVEQSACLLRQMPELFQMLMLKSWTRDNAQAHYEHLDELVDRIYEEDRQAAHSYFVSEVQALDTVVVVLNRLDKYINLFSYAGMTDSCVEELRQVGNLD